MACFPSLIIYVECPPLAIVNGDTMPSVWTFLTTLNTIYEWETVLKVSNTFQKKKKKNDQGIYGSLFISMSTINEMKV